MQVVRVILTIIYFVICFALIVLAMMQSKEDAGLSSTITGSSANNFFEKNKANTREGKLKRGTIILGVSFAVLSLVLGTIYMM